MDLITELRDDLRSDNLNRLWQKHGRWIIYAAVSMVAITAGMVYSKHHRNQVAMKATAIYMDATRATLAGNHEEAVKLLDSIDLPDKSEFKSLVLMKKAQALTSAGKQNEAAAVTKELAARSDIYGDIGKLMSGEGLDDTTKTPLASLRKEWQAWRLVDAGKQEEAALLFSSLAENEDVPQSQRDRVEMMAVALGKE